jgi:hypothetical protein
MTDRLKRFTSPAPSMHGEGRQVKSPLRVWKSHVRGIIG